MTVLDGLKEGVLAKYFTRRLGRQQDTEDLVQDVMVRLLQVDPNKQIDCPMAFIYGVASHVLADFCINADHERCHVTGGYDFNGDDCHCAAGVHSDRLETDLNLDQQIQSALAQLPATHAAVLVDHKYGGMSYEETAKHLDLSEFTVEKYVTQSKAALRRFAWDI